LQKTAESKENILIENDGRERVYTMKLQRARKSLIIILHEIYGLNDHIKSFSEVISNEGFDVISPNLLNREPFPYDQEDKAYNYFMNEVGFDKAFDEVMKIVNGSKTKYGQIFIIGFSIGATIAWMCSRSKVDGIVGFYGSRIRNYVEIEPQCPTLLFFPIYEKSFNVTVLQKQLESKERVDVHIVEAEHGFMNPYYRTYQSDEYSACLKKCADFIREIEKGAL